jgi:flagellar basal body-associated protein FliL
MEQKPEAKKTNISLLVWVLVALVILMGVWYWWFKKSMKQIPTQLPPLEKPAKKILPKEDSVAAINQDLERTEILELEGEFKEIDQDLNSL